ncbi:MAG: hypothetical protein Wins2KO_10140 [Winogradskyella sp.]
MARSGRLLKVESELEYIDNYVENDDFDSIKMLLNAFGVDCYNTYGRTFLILAAAKGNEVVLNYLIEAKSNLNFQDKNGYTALHFASQNGHYAIIETLIKNGADLNMKDVYGNPPIWTAIMNTKDDFSIVKILLLNNADIESENNYGKSPKKLWHMRFDYDITEIL